MPKGQLDAGEDVLVLDVRPAAAFAGEWGHVCDARSLPLEELPQRLTELKEHKQRPIRLICRSDKCPAQAAHVLAEAGFIEAQAIRDGMTAWRAHGWHMAGA